MARLSRHRRARAARSNRRRSVRIALGPEALECRALLTGAPYHDVWVNGAWLDAGTLDPAALTPGEQVTDGAITRTYGADAFSTVQDGVAAVAISGAVHVDPGIYSENVGISKNLTIEAFGNGAAVLQSQTAGAALTVEASCSVSIVGLTVRDSLIGVRVDGGSATISGATIRDNTFGIYVNGGSAAISGSQIFANTTGIRFFSGASGSMSGNNFAGGISSKNGTDLFVSTSAGSVTIGAGNAFAGATYIDNETNHSLDAMAANSFDGANLADLDPATASGLAGLYAVEDRITDGLDQTGTGLVRLKSGGVFLAESSETAQIGSLQRAVNLADSGNTIFIQAGTYVANANYIDAAAGLVAELNIDKPLSLVGPNADFDPLSGTVPAHPQAIVLPGTSNPDPADSTAVSIVGVRASHVTIRGLTINGNNPALATDPRTVVYNGVPIDAFDGISCYAGVGSLTIDHNIVRNATYTGIDLENGSAAANAANSISSNLIQNIGGAEAGFGTGIFLSNNFYGAVTNNVIDTALLGIQTQGFNAANPGGPGTAQISGNTIAAVGSGIWYNDFSAAASPFSVSNNTITAVEDAASLGRWVGVLISSQLASAGATFQNNTIDGTATAANLSQSSYGIEASGGSAVVTGSLIENNGTGIYALRGGSITVSSNSIIGNTTGIEIADARLVSATNNIISGGQYGIRIDPMALGIGPIGGGNLVGNSINGNTIAGLRNDSNLAINATGNWWGSGDGPNSPLNLYQPNNPAGDAILGDQVTFAPWLTNGTDTAPDSNGFQPTSLDSQSPALSDQLDQAATEGAAQTASLGSFSDADNSGGGAWHIIVNWGDNLPSDSFHAASSGTLGALVHTFAQEGQDTVTVTVIEQAGLSSFGTFRVIVNPPTFQVTAFSGSPSGFDVTFDRPVDVSKLNLYQGASDELGPADVTLVGQHSNTPVRGSLIWDAATNTAHFVASGGLLVPDTYSVDLASRANGWTDSNGSPLDGLATGVAGSGDYTNTFAVAAPTVPVLSLPDFARGPGQNVDVNADGTARTPLLPIHISDAGRLRSLSFEIDFDPSMLNLTGAVAASGLPADWSVTAQRTNSGGAAQLVVSASGTTALAAGPSDIVDLVGDIPSGASYRAAQVLKPIDVQLNTGANGVVVDEAVEKVAYFGDATGDSTLSGLDASFISRNVVSLDDGFSAYPLTDPRIIADVTGDGTLSGLDASFVAGAVVGNLPATIPAVPPHAAPVMSGLDPTVSIPSGTAAVAGATVTLPITVSEMNGLQAIDLVLAYDPSALSISPADISLSGFAATGGWAQAISLAAPGQIRLSLYGANPIAASGDGTLVNLRFHVSPTAANGEYPIGVVTAPSTASRLNEGLLTLSTSNGSIVVANGFEVDSMNNDGPGSLRQAIDSANGLGDAASTIHFELPAGPQTISLLAPLPATSASVVILLGASQDVTILGNIDGAGSLVVNAGSKLTVNHIVQNALVIGGTEGSFGTVTIAASDAAGNPLVSATPAARPQATAASTAAPSISMTPIVTTARASAVIFNTLAAAPLVRSIISKGFEPHGTPTFVASRPDELANKMAHDAAFTQTDFASVIDDALVDLLAGSIHSRHRGTSAPTPPIDDATAEWRALRG